MGVRAMTETYRESVLRTVLCERLEGCEGYRDAALRMSQGKRAEAAKHLRRAITKLTALEKEAAKVEATDGGDLVPIIRAGVETLNVIKEAESEMDEAVEMIYQFDLANRHIKGAGGESHDG